MMKKISTVRTEVSVHWKPGLKTTVIKIPFRERIRMLVFGKLQLMINVTDKYIISCGGMKIKEGGDQ